MWPLLGKCLLLCLTVWYGRLFLTHPVSTKQTICPGCVVASSLSFHPSLIAHSPLTLISCNWTIQTCTNTHSLYGFFGLQHVGRRNWNSWEFSGMHKIKPCKKYSHYSLSSLFLLQASKICLIIINIRCINIYQVL